MTAVQGTEGYECSVERFIERGQSLTFAEVCADFVSFLPARPARVLDVGAGAGQNSAALATMGYAVVAVEPMAPFLGAARAKYGHLPITWHEDSLPLLLSLPARDEFDFVLVEAVWHHLDADERVDALARITTLMANGAACALSLRNGPAGLGSRVFPTDSARMISDARFGGLECVFRKDDLPSVLPNKEDVRWSRLVFRKR